MEERKTLCILLYYGVTDRLSLIISRFCVCSPQPTLIHYAEFFLRIRLVRLLLPPESALKILILPTSGGGW